MPSEKRGHVLGRAHPLGSAPHPLGQVGILEESHDLRAQGVGIIYISHRMEEIFKITDRISILRDGQYQGTVATAETNEEAVTQMGQDKEQADFWRKKVLGMEAL